MKTGAPARTYRSAVPFPPIHPAVGCPGRRQVIPRGPRTGQPAGPAPPAGPPGRSQAAPRSSFSNSWPEAKLKLGGRRPQAQPQPAGPGPLASSNDSGPASSSGDSARRSSGNSSRTSLMDSTEEMRFSLSLTPEAVRVIQKRSLERQLLGKGKGRGKAPAPARSSSKLPAKPLQPASGAPQARSASGADIRSLVKISLLNDQHKYDDVEYEEEEDGPPDPALLRRCMEWLQGVEAAARLPRLVS